MKKARKKGRTSGRRFGIGISLLFVVCGLGINSCSSYDPSLYQGYDILEPSEEVKMNPVGFAYLKEGKWIVIWEPGFVPDPELSYAIINEEMGIWIFELKEEIRKLRRKR